MKIKHQTKARKSQAEYNEIADRIRADALKGLRVKDIKSSYGYHATSIYRILNGSRSNPNNHPPIDTAHINRQVKSCICHLLRAIGIKLKDIGRYLEITESRVSHILKLPRISNSRKGHIWVNTECIDNDGNAIKKGFYSVQFVNDNEVLLIHIEKRHTHFTNPRNLLGAVSIRKENNA